MVAFPGSASIGAYCASKFAVRGLLDALRLEVRFSYYLSLQSVCIAYAGLI